jgi:hypothetical protein
MKTISMRCASCGAGLQISPEMDHFACGYCGTSLSIVRQGGTVALKLVADSIAKVQVGTDRTAAELALVRLSKEIKALQRESDVMEGSIRYLEKEIEGASLQNGGRRASLIVRHALRAVVFGFFIGFIVNWTLEWEGNGIGVFVGLVAAMTLAVKYFRDPLKVSEWYIACSHDSVDKFRRQSAPLNADELEILRHASVALKKRLQELNAQVTAARAIVDS